MTISNEMMEVLKAYQVWPEGFKYLIGSNLEPSNFLDTSTHYFTHLEHIAMRCELFAACDWGYATHVDIKNKEEFYRYDGYCYKAQSGGVRCFKFDDLMPRPTPEEMKILEDSKINDLTDVDDKWAPEVDVICLGNVMCIDTKKYSYVAVVPLRNLGAEWVVQVGAGGRPTYCDEFRPLKSERDKFKEKARKINRSLAIGASEDDMLNALFDNGARFTGGGE